VRATRWTARQRHATSASTAWTRNSLDAVSDRDFVVETEAALALVMVHLSRLAEEIVWWSNPRFGFVRVADAFSTGSSMMPNKKNPDPAELVRGRVGRVIGALTGTLTMLKGLPLAYQRDLQEDKPPLFDAATTTEASMRVMAGLVATMAIDRERMAAAAGEGFTTATAVADGLVRRGVPFRVAHHVVGSLVGGAERAGLPLHDLSDTTIREALAAADDETARQLSGDPATPAAVRASASVEGALAAADVIGGTAPARVAEELGRARERLARDAVTARAAASAR
jgi:argininosuccinate lyase